MEPKFHWDMEWQEWPCELATESSDGSCNWVTAPEKQGNILPGQTFLRVEMPDGRVMRYHPECVPAGLLDGG